MAGVNGLALSAIAAGSLFAYAGIRGYSVLLAVKDLIAGTSPDAGQVPALIGATDQQVTVNQTSGTDTAVGFASGGAAPAGTAKNIQNYGLAQMVASTYGWAGGRQWAALTQVINRESGGDPNARNSSGAYGIAQALGHGTATTAGTAANEYGGYGVPDATARGANSGDARDQLIWMMAYIAAVYGNPVNAWANEQSKGYY